MKPKDHCHRGSVGCKVRFHGVLFSFPNIFLYAFIFCYFMCLATIIRAGHFQPQINDFHHHKYNHALLSCPECELKNFQELRKKKRNFRYSPIDYWLRNAMRKNRSFKKLTSDDSSFGQHYRYQLLLLILGLLCWLLFVIWKDGGM